MLLGEACSKCDHIAGVALKPSVQDELHQIYLAKGVHATTAIEGNTLTEDQVRAQIEGHLNVPPSQEYLAVETDNVITACNSIVRGIVERGPAELTRRLIETYNRFVLSDLPTQPDVVPGVLRTHSVTVGSYLAPPAEDCVELLDSLCEWLRGPDFDADRMGRGIAILQAVLAHLYLARIHAFGDGNGRTARLLEFTVLVNAGFPSPTAHLLSNHYNETRTEYYRHLDQASRSGGDVVPFIMYALRGLVDGLVEQLAVIRGFQLTLAWQSYVDEQFAGIRGPTADRRRLLVLGLSEAERPVPKAELITLTPGLAYAYARKTPKTLTRDLNELVRLDLVREEDDGWIARRDKMLAFLPARAVSPGESN